MSPNGLSDGPPIAARGRTGAKVDSKRLKTAQNSSKSTRNADSSRRSGQFRRVLPRLQLDAYLRGLLEEPGASGSVCVEQSFAFQSYLCCICCTFKILTYICRIHNTNKIYYMIYEYNLYIYGTALGTPTPPPPPGDGHGSLPRPLWEWVGWLWMGGNAG